MGLTPQQLDHFNAEGYLLLRGALHDQDLDPVIQEYEAHIDRRAQELLAQNKLTQTHADQPFNHRLAHICAENSEIYPELDIMHLRGRASFKFLRNPRLLDLIESLVGPEITCSPIQHVRAKLPVGLTPEGSDPHVAPWHQDAGVTWAEADPHFILTVWLPLTAATPDNGCLQIIPRLHGQGLRDHHTKAGQGLILVEIPDAEVITLPMEKGDLLLMHKEIPHRSTVNNSDSVRWSMDLRYQKTGTPTGRPFYPDFVARSRANPTDELTDYEQWCRLWIEGLEEGRRLKVSAHRWQRVP